MPDGYLFLGSLKRLACHFWASEMDNPLGSRVCRWVISSMFWP